MSRLGNDGLIGLTCVSSFLSGACLFVSVPNTYSLIWWLTIAGWAVGFVLAALCTEELYERLS